MKRLCTVCFGIWGNAINQLTVELTVATGVGQPAGDLCIHPNFLHEGLFIAGANLPTLWSAYGKMLLHFLLRRKVCYTVVAK